MCEMANHCEVLREGVVVASNPLDPSGRACDQLASLLAFATKQQHRHRVIDISIACGLTHQSFSLVRKCSTMSFHYYLWVKAELTFKERRVSIIFVSIWAGSRLRCLDAQDSVMVLIKLMRMPE